MGGWRNHQWREKEYLLWFVYWSSNAAREIERLDYPWRKTDRPDFYLTAGALELGDDYFTKDRGGRGQTFVPGLFFLAWHKQALGINGAEDAKRKFEQQTGLPFETYLSRLYPP
jgi:hypothetical protein